MARGDDGPDSDIDLLVDLDEHGGNPLLRIAGLSEELSAVMGTRVDVSAEPLLRDGVSASAREDMVAL